MQVSGQKSLERFNDLPLALDMLKASVLEFPNQAPNATAAPSSRNGTAFVSGGL